MLVNRLILKYFSIHAIAIIETKNRVFTLIRQESDMPCCRDLEMKFPEN